MSAGNSTQATVSGTVDPNGAKTSIFSGCRVTGVTTTANVQITLTFDTDVYLKCIGVSPLAAPSFMCTAMAAGTRNIISGTAQVTGGTGALAQTGVLGTNFLPYALCYNSVDGLCLKATIPFRSSWTNFTVATATLDLAVSGESYGSQC